MFVELFRTKPEINYLERVDFGSEGLGGVLVAGGVPFGGCGSAFALLDPPDSNQLETVSTASLTENVSLTVTEAPPVPAPALTSTIGLPSEPLVPPTVPPGPIPGPGTLADAVTLLPLACSSMFVLSPRRPITPVTAPPFIPNPTPTPTVISVSVFPVVESTASTT